MTLLEIIRADYPRMLAEVGFDPDKVTAMVRNTADQCPMPAGFEHLRLAPSPIEGQGLFTDRTIQAGEIIGPARIAGKRTPLGRYANHSPWPNTEFRPLPSGDLESIALWPIPEGAEVLNNYRQGAWLCGATFNEAEMMRTQEIRNRQFHDLQAVELEKQLKEIKA